MNIRDAILKAADRIELKPDCFSFLLSEIPDSERGRGCAIAWIGYELGFSGWANKSVLPALGVPVDEWRSIEPFGDRMRALHGSNHWVSDARDCARALRLYADKYHPAPKVERNFARELMANLPAERIPDEVAL